MADPTKKKKTEDEVEIIEPEKVTEEKDIPPDPNDISQYVAFLEAMKTTKRHLTVAPTNTPKNFYDQIQFFDDGVDVRIYIWINGTWRYVDLT